jgi:hypothetical protein
MEEIAFSLLAMWRCGGRFHHVTTVLYYPSLPIKNQQLILRDISYFFALKKFQFYASPINLAPYTELFIGRYYHQSLNNLCHIYDHSLINNKLLKHF